MMEAKRAAPLIGVGALVGFLAQPFAVERIENKETLRLEAEVLRLIKRVAAADERVELERLRSDKLEAQLRDTQIRLETRGFSEKSPEDFDYELVCRDYAADVAEEYFLDRADDYCSEKSGEPYEP